MGLFNMLERVRNQNPQYYQLNTKDIRAVILAGGRGKRLLPLTDQNPKVILEVAGKPVINYIIDNLNNNGIKIICASLLYKPEKILPLIEKRISYDIQKIDMGTAGALKRISTWLSDPFIVCNGDTVSNINIAKLLKGHELMNSKATVFTHQDEFDNGGTYIFSKSVLNYIPDDVPFMINDLFKALNKVPPSVTLSFQDELYWDIGTPKGLRRAQIFYEKLN